MSQPAEDNAQANDEPSAGLFAEIRQVYRASLKPSDIFWNLYVARPIAAIVVALLRRTKITPNQVTFAGLFVFFGVLAAMALIPGWQGILVAGLALQASYVLDCADGQLARYTNMTSDVGAYLDFLIDEVKAMILVGACTLRLYLFQELGYTELWLLIGMASLFLVSSATSLTTFVRRPEYAGDEIKPGTQGSGPQAPKGLVAKILWLVQKFLRWLVHYPSWFLYIVPIAALTQIDGAILFLVPFLGVYLLYLARTGLGVLLKLGRRSFYEA